MKYISTTISLIFLASIIFAQHADDVLGKYHLPNDLDIEIFKDNGKFLGKIIGLNKFEDGQTKDINNPDDSKHSDLLIGKTIIRNLEFNSENKQWINGEMYGPGEGMVFNLKITEIREHNIEVVGSKYFFWKTLEWDKL